MRPASTSTTRVNLILVSAMARVSAMTGIWFLLSGPPAAVLDRCQCVEEHEGKDGHVEDPPQEEVGPVAVVARDVAVVDGYNEGNQQHPHAVVDGHGVVHY